MAAENKNLQYRELDDEESKIVANLHPGHPFITIKLGPKGYYLPKHYMTIASEIYNLELRAEDIFVATYQRSGTTLMQELVWILANDFNYEKAAEIPLTGRYKFLEEAMLYDDHAGEACRKAAVGDPVKMNKMLETVRASPSKVLAGMPSPRFVKTHQPMSLLPPALLDVCRVVYVARDPRDVAVSSYHHARLFWLSGLDAPFKDMWNAFIRDLFMQTPFFEHIKEAWALRDHPNMLFMFYEDIIKDMSSAVQRVAAFLGKELTPQQLEKLCDHLSINNFKNNKSVNYEDAREFGFLRENETFIRKGASGGWREYFDEEMLEQADHWIADNLKDTDLKFPSINIKQ